MGVDAKIQCSCGKVTGTAYNLSPSSTNHVLCPCDGCQAYAQYLDRADDMLDAAGNSNIFQMNPKHFKITGGQEYIACVKITPKGPLRWFANCCKTPLGNSFPKGGIPFLGVLPICIGHKGTANEVVRLVGPARATVNARHPLSLGQKIKLWAMFVRFFSMLFSWRIFDGKSWKPFFNKATLKPIAKPVKISDTEREVLYGKVIK